MTRRIVTLLTDFGTSDSYVGELKGRLLQLVPDATIVDITHDIAPGDIQAAAFVLGRAWRAFAAGTVHVAVVDPGVGGARRALAVAAGGHTFVGPDNGLFDGPLGATGAQAFALPVPADASPTFHGRDVFAPAAARLLTGEPVESLGTPVSDAVRLAIPEPRRQGKHLVGQVIYVDRFGTLVTNIPGTKVEPGATVRVGPNDLLLRTTYADAAVGEPLALIGSSGLVEIAVRDGRADQTLGLSRGAEVRVS